MNVPEKHRAVAHAWVDGAEVEMRNPLNGERWTQTLSPDWDERLEYRINLTKPSINWSHVGTCIVAIATDSSGDGWCYADVPERGHDKWHGCIVCSPEVFASFKPGTCDWRDSLIVRPGYEENES